MLFVGQLMSVIAQKTIDIDLKLETCMRDSLNFTTYGMHTCINTAILDWDDRLNQAYKRMMKKLPDEDGMRLREAQRKWIDLLELDKQLLREFTLHQQGSMYGVTHGLVVVELVKSRALVLEAFEKELQ